MAIALETGGSRRLVNHDKNTNKLEHHKQTCIPTDVSDPSINRTPDKSVPISLPAALAM